MNFSWRLSAAFYFPIHLAVGVFYFSGKLLGGEVDCRGLCDFPGNCADLDALLMYDCVNYLGICLVILSFVLPSMMLFRRKKIIQTNIFA